MHKAYYQTPLGYAEITASDQAVFGVRLVDGLPKKTEKTSGAASAVLKQCISELDEYFSGGRKKFTVKLERNGTDFQKKVWRALEKISYGGTASYADIAEAVGSPKAVRAVGLANSKNPHWVIVPCHRVIGKNKKLVGYAGGLVRKKWLLDHEKSLS